MAQRCRYMGRAEVSLYHDLPRDAHRNCCCLGGSRFRSLYVSDYVARHDHFHAAIQLASGSSIVGSYGTRLAKATRNHVGDGHSGIEQIIAHSGGAFLGKGLVELIAAGAVSMTFDF